MKLETAYIMSCLPDVSNISDPLKLNRNILNKQIRLSGIETQLNWLYLNKIQNIKYQSMRWLGPDKERIMTNWGDKFNSIEFIDSKPIHFSTSRNRLLMEYYKSDEDWALFLDDDGLIDPRTPDNFSEGTNSNINWSETGNFIKWLQDLGDDSCLSINSANKISLISPLNPGAPGIGAWKKEWTDENSDYIENWNFIRTISVKGTTLFIKNLWKHSESLVWFRPAYEMPAGEDFAFSVDIFLSGHAAYVCRNFLLKELSSEAQGTWQKSKSKEEISRERNAYKTFLENTFHRFGIEKKDIGEKVQVHTKEMFKKLPYPSEYLEKWIKGTNVPTKFKVKK